ncbi:ATP-dependent protease ClpP, protease subunit [Azotobacter beijerinckii]|uniref:ATP-dependent protease ClpP, protease subunit n=1 Tax=Azotobacter beijerinckii TaxID=170623 RepID=A0A1H6ZGI1_9GAMM|nr:ATP-dependent Clp protease proteolytic subunit [Azotobacter beijerinckii]MDV7213018.1 ATP-dependent Clp protease proteolytic subunit [Azotobacter beijerinckii]SEJ51796.1 ATP-dependent protease ClpP, protease subunit [Azotobacter beijerinckii]SEJ62865.1 ATP-dependent protease ClpP, protease subunit [Azotobacter beijerinckii]SEP99473.1 ATP-dependent protease ClpP, protease subunit [Azotobacter beijerinckii]SFA82572.1 ATP-dependent protease ClpP, protease subunit [Azotobacter beijerinckii]
MTNHVIHFTGPINSSTCGQLINKCSQALKQDASELTIKIATMGGECSYGFSLYNFLMSLPIPVNTHNLGTVESMGNIIFLAGQRRTACHHSKFLFHPFHWTIHGSVDHARMSEYAMSLDFDRVLYARIVAERTQGAGEPLDVSQYLTADSRIVTPDEAIAAGLIHAVEDLGMSADTTSWCIHS